MPRIYPLQMKFNQKAWGYEVEIFNGERYCGKKLVIQQGHWLSYHHHEVKDEVLFVATGRVWFTHNELGHVTSEELGPGHAFRVVPGVKHQIQAIEDTVIFEFSTHHDDEDSIRTTRKLVVDHGDNGFALKPYLRPEVPTVIPVPEIPTTTGPLQESPTVTPVDNSGFSMPGDIPICTITCRDNP